MCGESCGCSSECTMLRSLCTLVTDCKSRGLSYAPCRTVCMHCSSTTSLTHHRMESKAILYTNGVCYNLKYIVIGRTNLCVHSCMRHANHVEKINAQPSRHCCLVLTLHAISVEKFSCRLVRGQILNEENCPTLSPSFSL